MTSRALPLATLALAVAAIVGCSDGGRHTASEPVRDGKAVIWRAETVTAYTANCVGRERAADQCAYWAAFCACVLNRMQAQYTEAEFEAIENQMKQGGQPGVVKEVRAACVEEMRRAFAVKPGAEEPSPTIAE